MSPAGRKPFRSAAAPPPRSDDPIDRLTLVDMVNRVLDKGVAVTGEVVIGVGGVDLIYLGLQLLLSSADTLERIEGLRPIQPLPGRRKPTGRGAATGAGPPAVGGGAADDGDED